MRWQKEAAGIVEAVRDHHLWFRDVLPMIASENITSLPVRLLAASDFSHRYAEGKANERYYQGCKYIDIVEERTVRLALELFRAEHVNVQPISGTVANIAAFFALTEPGDSVISLGVPMGGHISHARYSAAGIRGLRTFNHPFDNEAMNIDPDGMVKLIREVEPRVIVFGASLFLFPHPVREAVDAAGEVGARIVYDGAHVLGLIAGGRFQDPLREGADVLTGSTHKTFPGPQGALICCKGELAEDIDQAVFPGTVSNHHLHHLAGLGVALAEMLEFGRDYAGQIIRNSKALAQALWERGFKVLCEGQGFTASHQVVVDVSGQGGGDRVARALEQGNIIANKNLLPWDDVSEAENPSGLRLGTQELTRLGMREGEMEEVADFIWRIAMKGESPEKVKRDVTEFKRSYQYVCYSFRRDRAYDFYEKCFKNESM